ncbi:hypothetical protein BOTU111921_11240 [Bordetella tumbae]|uniref:hypothetical protein n=1 Tax=Bordetella tumbae TaxID=1649139 RepID=UPI0039F1260B
MIMTANPNQCTHGRTHPANCCVCTEIAHKAEIAQINEEISKLRLAGDREPTGFAHRYQDTFGDLAIRHASEVAGVERERLYGLACGTPLLAQDAIHPFRSGMTYLVDAFGNIGAAWDEDGNQLYPDLRESDPLYRLVKDKFTSGNAIPVERITIVRAEYDAAIAEQGKEAKQ